MNRKTLTMIMACTLLLAGCGDSSKKSKDNSTEPKIVARNAALSDVVTPEEDEVTADEVTSEEEYAEEAYQPPLETLTFENGIELASVRSSKGTIPIQSGDNLRDVLMLTDLRYIKWDQFYDENDIFRFYGKGYALRDVKKDGTDKGQDPSYVYFETVDAYNTKMGDLEADKSLYRICSIKASAEDVNSGDLSVTFTGGVTVGMSKNDIDKMLSGDGIKRHDYANTSLFETDEHHVLYVIYDDANNADTIYSMPRTCIDIKHYVEMAEPKKPEKAEKKEEQEEED